LHTRNKDIEYLTIEDLKFMNSEIENYASELKLGNVKTINRNETCKYSNNSINSKISSIVSLYKFLNKNEYDVDPEKMAIEWLDPDGESYGKLTLSQAELIAEKVRSQVKGYEKSMLIKLAIRTSIRQGALLSLTYDKIRWNE